MGPWEEEAIMSGGGRGKGGWGGGEGCMRTDYA